MNESKISIAEIEELRKKADAERQVRREIAKNISGLRFGIAIPAERLMKVIRRGNISEIREMLQAYSGESTSMTRICMDKLPLMSPEAQLYIYEHWQKGPYHEIWEFLKDNVPYTDEFAIRLIQNDIFSAQQQLSEKVEKYYLSYKLNHQKCEEAISGRVFFSRFFGGIKAYFCRYGLTPENEAFLIELCLNPRYTRDSYIDSCREVVSHYIDCRKSLQIAGEKALIASGSHDLIMKYIRIAQNGLKEEEELLARGNREEVTAYFERYATL